MTAALEITGQAPAAAGLLSHASSALLGAGGVGGVWGVWSWLSERSKAKATAPAAMTQSLATFQAALNDQAKALIASFRDEVAEMRQRIETLERENEHCRGENRQAAQRISSLEAQLRRAGVALPEYPPQGSFMILEGDRATMLRQAAAEELGPAS